LLGSEQMNLLLLQLLDVSLQQWDLMASAKG